MEYVDYCTFTTKITVIDKGGGLFKCEIFWHKYITVNIVIITESYLIIIFLQLCDGGCIFIKKKLLHLS